MCVESADDANGKPPNMVVGGASPSITVVARLASGVETRFNLQPHTKLAWLCAASEMELSLPRGAARMCFGGHAFEEQEMHLTLEAVGFGDDTEVLMLVDSQKLDDIKAWQIKKYVGAVERSSSRGAKAFLVRMWAERVGRTSMRITPTLAIEFPGYQWGTLTPEDREFLFRFDYDGGMPLVPFLLWKKLHWLHHVDPIDNDQWECLVSGRIAATASNDAVMNNLLTEVVELTDNLQHVITGRFFDRQYKQCFVNLWKIHAGQRSLCILPVGVRSFAMEMMDSGYKDWELDQRDEELLQQLSPSFGLSLITFAVWSEDRYFNAVDWLQSHIYVQR